MQFLHKDVYLKGIEIYESIIKAYASFNDHGRDGASKDELWAFNDDGMSYEQMVQHLPHLSSHFLPFLHRCNNKEEK